MPVWANIVRRPALSQVAVRVSRIGRLSLCEDIRALRLKSHLFDLRAGYANSATFVASFVRPRRHQKNKGHHFGCPGLGESASVRIISGLRSTAVQRGTYPHTNAGYRQRRYANSATFVASFVRPRSHQKEQGTPEAVSLVLFGDSWENRTPVSALRGPCLSRLTNEPCFNRLAIVP